MTALAATQAAMHGWLLHGDPGIATQVHGPGADDRLRIHADAYRLRLVEVLGNDFPVTKAVLGEDGFDAVALDYVQAHPSIHPSLRHFGRAFAGRLRPPAAQPRTLRELARFEWMQGEVFDAVDADVLTVDDIASLPADAWPMLRLRLQPSTRLLALACNAPALVDAHARGHALPALRVAPMAEWLLWRSGGDVHWRRLDADEAELLRAISEGEPFNQLCERASAFHPLDGPLRTASLLKRWLADGLLANAKRPTED